MSRPRTARTPPLTISAFRPDRRSRAPRVRPARGHASATPRTGARATLGIPGENLLQQREIDGRALDVQRLVIFDDGHRAQWVERARRHRDCLTQDLEPGFPQDLASLPRVVAITIEREREGLEPR